MIKQLILAALLWNLCLCPALSQVETGFQLVKAKTIDANLARQFPVDKSFQGISATFSDPKILINTLDQTIKLQMNASADNDTQHLAAKLIFTGVMLYDQFSESYFFESLLLDSFKIEQDTYANSQPTIKVIKQSLINDFEDIVLFRLTEINQLAAPRPADEIEISQNQLRFIWKKPH